MAIKRGIRFSETVIVIGAIFMSALMWAVAVERVNFHQSEAESATFEENAHLLLVLEEHTRALLSQVKQTLSFVQLQVQQGQHVDFYGILGDVSVNHSFIRTLYAVDAAGRVVDSSGRLEEGDIVDRQVLSRVAASDDEKLYLGTPWLDSTGTWRMQIARRLIRGGTFRGAAVAVVDPLKFAAFYH